MDELQKYYEYLRQNGADVPKSYDSFRSTLQDEKSARTYYDYLKKNSYDVPDTYDSFAGTFKLKNDQPRNFLAAGIQKVGSFLGLLPSKEKTATEPNEDLADQVLTVSPEQRKLYDDQKKRFDEIHPDQPNEQDPLKTIMTPAREEFGKLATNSWQAQQNTRSETTSQQSLSKVTKANIDFNQNEKIRMDDNAMTKLGLIQEDIENKLVPEAQTGTNALLDYGKQNGLDIKLDADGIVDLSPENLAKLPNDNETINAIIKKSVDYNQIKKDLDIEGNSIPDAAVLWAQRANPHLAEQLSAIQDSNDTNAFDKNIPHALLGKIINSYMQDQNLAVIASHDPKLLQQYQDLKQNLLIKYPEFGINVVANEMSRQREAEKKNNWFGNFAFGSSDYMNDLANRMYANDPQRKQIYDTYIKNNLNKYIDSPGVLDKAVDAIKNAGSGILNTLGTASGITSEGESIYQGLEKENSQVSSDPKSWLHKLSSATGDFTGLIGTMALGGNYIKALGLVKNAATASHIMLGLTFWGDEMQEARKLYPGEPDKQFARASLSTAAFMIASNLFPSGKVGEALKKMSPEIDKIVELLSEGKITQAAAKDQLSAGFSKMLDFGKEVLKQDLKATGELTAITGFKQNLDHFFNLNSQAYREEHPDDELVKTAQTAALGSFGPAAFTVHAERNAVKNSLFDIAEQPQSYIDILERQASIDPEAAAVLNDKKKTITDLSITKTRMDEDGVPESKQKSYLLQTANEAILQKKLAETNEPVLRKKIEEQIKLSQEKKAEVLNFEYLPQHDVLPQEEPLPKEEQPEAEIKSHVPPAEPEVKEETATAPVTEEKPVTEIKPVEEVPPVKEAEEVIDDKVEELKKKPDATTTVLKAQKKDILDQLTEINKITSSGLSDEAKLKKIKKLGYKINNNDQVQIYVKDDGQFKIHYSSIEEALDRVKKKFPDKPATMPGIRVASSTKNRLSDIAKSRGSVEKNLESLNIAKENLDTAKKSGNKNLEEVYSKQLEKETAIYGFAKHINFDRVAAENDMQSDKEAQALKAEARAHDRYYREIGFHDFSVFNYMEAKKQGLLGKGLSYKEIKIRLEAAAENLTLPEMKNKYEAERLSDEQELKDKFGRKDGNGLRKPTGRRDQNLFDNLQRRINIAESRGKIINDINKKADESTNAETTTENKQSDKQTEDTEQSAGRSAETGSTAAEDTEQASAPNKKLQKKYDTVAGLTPTKIPGRIDVEPIARGKTKALSDIILDLSQGLKQRTFFSKLGRRSALGSYSPSNKGVKIRYAGDLDTTAHEIGHSLDDMHGIYTEAKNDPAILKELKPFSRHGSNPQKGHPDPKAYRAAEGIAEWIRAYIVNPDEAKKQAPKTYALYEKLVPDESKKAIDIFSDDIRTWAGSSAGDIVMSNVEYAPEKEKNLLQKLFDKQKSSSKFSINAWDKVAANFLKPLQAFERAWKYAKDLKGVKKVLPEDDVIILSRLLLGIDGKYGEILKTGIVDGRDNVLKDKDGNAKNLKWLLEPLNNADIKSIDKDMQDVIKFMVAERTVELGQRFQRKDILTGVGGGIFNDYDVAKEALNDIKIGDPDRLARIEKASDRYREFADDILKYMVEKGRLSTTDYQNIKKDNIHYVALQRILESGPEDEIEIYKKAGGKLGSVGEPVREIKGSTKKIINPYLSLMDALYKGVKEADRNDILKSFRDMIYEPRMMNAGEPRRFSDIGVQGTSGDKEAIKIFINGKPEHWLFQKDVYRALKSMDSDGYKLPEVLKIHAKVLRFTTTNFPVFAVRNWIRDTQDRLIKSNANRWFSGIKNLVGKKEDWNAIARAGGLNSGYYLKSKHFYNGLLTSAKEEMAKSKKIIILDGDHLKRGWEKYESLLYKSETSNRVAEYRSARDKAKKQGMDDYNASLYAAYHARDLIDFGVAGHWMKVINQIIPFSNAAVQGLRSTIIRARENPTGFLVRTMLYSVLPQAALWAWNHRNKEDGDEYENLPAYQRDMFWMFKVGDNKWGAIPKPYELSLASAAADRALSKWNWGNKDAYEGYAGTVLKSLLPFDDGNFAGSFQPEVEVLANRDFFRNKNIIPPDEDALNLSLRHTESASRLGKILQQYSGMDARKWDHFIKAQFSYMGNFAEDLSDIGREGSRYGFDITDTGLFKNSPAYNSPAVQNFVDFAKEYGLTLRPEYKDFSSMAADYFNATKDSDKDKLAKEMIEFAKMQLQDWKDEGVAEEKVEKVQEKKEENK